MRLIDADKLDDVVLDLNQKGWTITRNDYKRIDGVLFEFPTIDPVKYGRWMGTVCSVCGESFSEYYDCKFCPNCGAKMDEVSK